MGTKGRKAIGGVLLLAVVGAVVLYAAGAFGHGAKVAPGRAPEPPPLPAPPRTAQARREAVPLEEDAVGTVRSRTVVEVAAQVIGRVLEVRRVAGQPVDAKDPLILLDDREYAARLAQAKKAVDAADAARRQAVQAKVQGEARLKQATLANDRARRLLATKTISTEQAEAAETEFLQAQAALAQTEAAIAAAEAQGGEASQVVAAADVALGHTKIASPITGVVSERRVEPGDLAFPGRTLLIVLDPKALRLEALVRERLISSISLEQELEVTIPASGTRVRGKVAEIVPSADPLSRTFTVRVDFGSVPGVYAGMFGRLRIPLGTREAVRVPSAAVERVGQLETVTVKVQDRWERRLVTTGLVGEDGSVEVLSGLGGGETVGLAAAGGT